MFYPTAKPILVAAVVAACASPAFAGLGLFQADESQEATTPGQSATLFNSEELAEFSELNFNEAAASTDAEVAPARFDLDTDTAESYAFFGNEARDGRRFGPNAGDWEFTFTGAAANDGRFKQGQFGLNFSLGYYIMRDLSVELRQGIAYRDFGESVWSGSTFGALQYHFDLNRLRPFVEASIGGFYAEDIRDTGAFGLGGGARYYVKEDTFLYGRVEHQWLFRRATTDERVFGNRHFLYTLGIGFNF